MKHFAFGLKDVFGGLCELLEGEEIIDLCKVDSNTFNFIVTDEQAVDILTTVGILRTNPFQLLVLLNKSWNLEYIGYPAILNTHLWRTFPHYHLNLTVKEMYIFHPLLILLIIEYNPFNLI